MLPGRCKLIVLGIAVIGVAVIVIIRGSPARIPGLSGEDATEIRARVNETALVDPWLPLRNHTFVGWRSAIHDSFSALPNAMRENRRVQIGGHDLRADGSVAVRVLRDGRHHVTWILEKRRGHWKIVGTKTEHDARASEANPASAVDAPIASMIAIDRLGWRATDQRRYAMTANG